MTLGAVMTEQARDACAVLVGEINYVCLHASLCIRVSYAALSAVPAWLRQCQSRLLSLILRYNHLCLERTSTCDVTSNGVTEIVRANFR